MQKPRNCKRVYGDYPLILRSPCGEDLGDTWVEFGIGANFNWTPNTYTYVDLERTNGGEVKENWRWNIGLRHVF